MKISVYYIKSLIAIMYSLSVFSQEVVRESKNELHEKAVKLLNETNFFKNGRGMILPPDMIELADRSVYIREFVGSDFILKNRYGLIKENKKFKGLFTAEYQNSKIGVLGCVFCHTGRAAGITIPGLGNKLVDVYQIGKDLKNLYNIYETLYLPYLKDEHLKEIFYRSQNFANVLSNEKISNKTQGLVPISIIRYWLYTYQGKSYPEDLTPGAVKVPVFWGYAEKRKVGQFCDGGGNGKLPGWGAAVELAAGQDPFMLNDVEYLKKLELVEDNIGNILPPKYPFAINSKQAEKGKKLFNENCLKCHGEHERDKDGFPVFTAPKHISIKKLQTDNDRLSGNTPEFYELVANNPINHVLQANYFEPGYFAPKLFGVWARFPYLHNGSVPNIYELLSSPEERSAVFSLKDAGEEKRFDTKKLGLKTENKKSKEYKELLNSNARNVYKTSKLGQSNSGHHNYPKFTETEKDELIEYLKTL
jgi:hypothetical protein